MYMQHKYQRCQNYNKQKNTNSGTHKSVKNASQQLQDIEAAIKVAATPSLCFTVTVDCQLRGRGMVQSLLCSKVVEAIWQNKSHGAYQLSADTFKPRRHLTEKCPNCHSDFPRWLLLDRENLCARLVCFATLFIVYAACSRVYRKMFCFPSPRMPFFFFFTLKFRI